MREPGIEGATRFIVVLEGMNSKVDHSFVDLRERILFGEFPAGSPLFAEDIVSHLGVSMNMARQLLLSLGGAGYLTRRGRSYVVSTFTKEQVEEWRLALCAFVEIGAVRLALEGGGRLREAEQFLNASVRRVDVNHEDFFIGAMALTTMVLGGPRSTLAQLVEQFIPQAFFRLLWLSDAYADRTGFLVEAGDRFLPAARSGNLEAVREACRFFFDSTAPALYTLVNNMDVRSYPEKMKIDGFQSIEPDISGMPTYVGSMRSSTAMLRPLSEIDRTTFRL